MRLLELKARNLGPFEDVDLDFRGAGSVIGVRATYEGQPERSNRAGKSFLVYDLPLFALTGYSRTGTAADVVRRGRDSGWAQVAIELPDRVLRVKTTQRGTSTKIEVEGFEGLSQRDAKAHVEEALGLPVSDLRAVSLFEQGDVLGFLAGDQRRILGRWLDQSKWDKAHAEAGALLREAEAAATRAEDAVEDAQGAVDSLEELEDEVEARTAIVERTDAELREAERVAECEDEETELREARSALSAAEAQGKADRILASATESGAVSDASAALTEVRIRVSRLEGERDRVADAVARKNDAANRARRNMADAVAEKDRASERAKRALDSVGDVNALCHVTDGPPCELLVAGRKLDRESALDTAVEEERAAAREVSARTREALTAAAAATAEAENLSVAEAALQEAVELWDAHRREYETAKTEARRVREKREAEIDEEVEQARSRVRAAEEALAAARGSLDPSEVRRRRERAARARDDLSEVKIELARCRAKAADLDDLVAAAALAQSKARRLRILRVAFSKTGIPARVVEGYLDHLAADANDFLERLGAEPRIEWRTWRELSRWQSECHACGWHEATGTGKRKRCADCGTPWRKGRKEDFACVLQYGRHEAPLESDSGGGKTLVALAVRFALSRLVASARGVDADLLILDEPFAALDVVNLRIAVALVTDVLAGYGIRQSFVISHVAEVQDAVGDLVTIVRSGDVSSVETSW